MRNEGSGLRRLCCHSTSKYRQQKTGQYLKKSEQSDQQSSHSWIGAATSICQVIWVKSAILKEILRRARSPRVEFTHWR